MAITWAVIRTPREVLGATSADDYQRKHRRHIRMLRQRGVEAREHPVTVPVPVIISGGVWLVLCDCRGGAAASPEWQVARCYDCGAVYTHLVWPEDATDIANALLVRPEHARHWWGGAAGHDRMRRILGNTIVDSYDVKGGESLQDLRTENMARGVAPAVGSSPPSEARQDAAVERLLARDA